MIINNTMIHFEIMQLAIHLSFQYWAITTDETELYPDVINKVTRWCINDFNIHIPKIYTLQFNLFLYNSHALYLLNWVIKRLNEYIKLVLYKYIKHMTLQFIIECYVCIKCWVMRIWYCLCKLYVRSLVMKITWNCRS